MAEFFGEVTRFLKDGRILGEVARVLKSWPNPGRAGQILEEMAESW
jgi:hypothetical protein